MCELQLHAAGRPTCQKSLFSNGHILAHKPHLCLSNSATPLLKTCSTTSAPGTGFPLQYNNNAPSIHPSNVSLFNLQLMNIFLVALITGCVCALWLRAAISGPVFTLCPHCTFSDTALVLGWVRICKLFCAWIFTGSPCKTTTCWGRFGIVQRCCSCIKRLSRWALTASFFSTSARF